MAPTAFRVDAATQGVHAGVQVRADSQPVHPDVVADIDDGRGVGSGEQLPHALQEARTADSADQNDDPEAGAGRAVRLFSSHIRTAYAFPPRRPFTPHLL